MPCMIQTVRWPAYPYIPQPPTWVVKDQIYLYPCRVILRRELLNIRTSFICGLSLHLQTQMNDTQNTNRHSQPSSAFVIALLHRSFNTLRTKTLKTLTFLSYDTPQRGPSSNASEDLPPNGSTSRLCPTRCAPGAIDAHESATNAAPDAPNRYVPPCHAFPHRFFPILPSFNDRNKFALSTLSAASLHPTIAADVQNRTTIRRRLPAVHA